MGRTSWTERVHEEDIRAYVRRDWRAVAELKDRFWVEQRERQDSLDALRGADQLRRQVVALRPDWPSENEREADRAVHGRVSEALGRVGRAGRR